jgi:hypothetical protein
MAVAHFSRFAKYVVGKGQSVTALDWKDLVFDVGIEEDPAEGTWICLLLLTGPVKLGLLTFMP